MKKAEITETEFERERKSWQTPQVIAGTLEQAELNAGTTDDGDALATPDNS